MIEWWFVAVPAAFLSGVAALVWLDEQGVPEGVTYFLAPLVGLAGGAFVLALGGAI